jgi:hypothetical protein
MDRREAILARLVELAESIDGINEVFRNPTNVPEEAVPAIVIFDGDETVEDADNDSRRPSNSPVRIGMTPEVYIVLGDKPENVGTLLNGLRFAFLKAVNTDAELMSLTGVDARPGIGDVRYNAGVTSLSVGREMFGDFAIQITFTYLLRFD